MAEKDSPPQTAIAGFVRRRLQEAGAAPSGWEIVTVDRPSTRGPEGASWFNDDEWSGVETPHWTCWVGNRERSCRLWGMDDSFLRGHAAAVAIPAILRRSGLMDGHGAIVAPDPTRPDDGVFVCGSSGAGKSTLTLMSVLNGASYVSDDSVSVRVESNGDLTGFSRRSVILASPDLVRRHLPGSEGEVVDTKAMVRAERHFAHLWRPRMRLRAIVFLSRAVERVDKSSIHTLRRVSAYSRLLMAHPILALDRGARSAIRVAAMLATLPGYELLGGSDLLTPEVARTTLASVMPAA